MINFGIYKAEYKNGKWLVRHGNKIKVWFSTRAQAEEYLNWVMS